LAKELKVDLSTLKGSGPHGRIVAEDVETAANKGKQPDRTATPAKTAAVALFTSCNSVPASSPTPAPLLPWVKWCL